MPWWTRLSCNDFVDNLVRLQLRDGLQLPQKTADVAALDAELPPNDLAMR